MALRAAPTTPWSPPRGKSVELCIHLAREVKTTQRECGAGLYRMPPGIQGGGSGDRGLTELTFLIPEDPAGMFFLV